MTVPDPMGPMIRLDEAVKHFTAKALDREGVVTGWVLMVASTRFDDNGNVCYAYDYSTGPDCDLVRAVGLMEVSRMRMRQAVNRDADDD